MVIDCTSPDEGYIGLEGSNGQWYRRFKFLADGKLIYAFKIVGSEEITKVISEKPAN